MGTNYYIVSDNGYKAHVGKATDGWVFTFQGAESRTSEAWMNRLFALHRPGQCDTLRLEDEYGKPIDALTFWETVAKRSLGYGDDEEPLNSRTFGLREGPQSDQGHGMAWDFLRGTRWIEGGFSFLIGDFC